MSDLFFWNFYVILNHVADYEPPNETIEAYCLCNYCTSCDAVTPLKDKYEIFLR